MEPLNNTPEVVTARRKTRRACAALAREIIENYECACCGDETRSAMKVVAGLVEEALLKNCLRYVD